MKTYLLKCEKWFSTNMSIFSEGQKVGTFYSGMYSSNYRVLLGKNEFDIRKKNVFSNNLSIYSQGELLASVRNFPFKNQSIITTADMKQYILKCNIWSSRYHLYGNDEILGECRRKMTSTYLSFDDRVDDFLIATIIAKTHLAYETAMFSACFISVFITTIIT